MTASVLASRWRSVASTVLGLGALVTAAALLAMPEATGSGSPRDRAAGAETKSVTVAPVVTAEHVRELRFSGVVRAHRRAELAFVLSGRVAERLVELGSHVQEGDALVRLDQRQLRRAVQSAEASVARADADLAHGELERDRVRRLQEAQAVAAAAADDAAHTTNVAAATRRQASAQAGLARRDLAEGVLRAPFAGTIGRVEIEPGEFAQAGRPVIEIVGDDVLEVEVRVPESILATVREGDLLKVELPLVGRTVQGTVTTIGTAAPEAAGLFPVVVTLATDADLRPGMTAQLVVTSPVAAGLAVPVEAIVDRTGSTPKLFEVRDAKVHVHDVEVLAIAGREAIVTAPLRTGDEVITRGQANLADGDDVVVPR